MKKMKQSLSYLLLLVIAAEKNFLEAAPTSLTSTSLQPSPQPSYQKGSPEVVPEELKLNNQYTPLDMAEYIFWTGDEKGITLAIEECLQAGLMTREEAVVFLQDIKNNLNLLQIQYSSKFKIYNERYKSNTADSLIEELQQLGASSSGTSKHILTNDIEKKKAVKTLTDLNIPKVLESSTSRPTGAGESYDELMDRLRVADSLYTEYSLEEVIYQLAKLMFREGLTRPTTDAKEALAKFVKFLETEADQGHISRPLEKKVLDVLIASLTDTLSEHPEIQSIREHSTADNRQAAFRQIARMIPPETDAAHAASAAAIQLKDKNMKALWGIGK